MVTIVMGPPCAGKSTYIKEHLADKTIIDLWDFQKDDRFVTPETVWASYERCAQALQDAIKTEKDVVLEHTLMKAIRREYYIQKIREVSDCDIDIICILPSAQVLSENSRKRHCCDDLEHCESMLDFVEVPDLSEGYRKVTVVGNAR